MVEFNVGTLVRLMASKRAVTRSRNKPRRSLVNCTSTPVHECSGRFGCDEGVAHCR